MVSYFQFVQIPMKYLKETPIASTIAYKVLMLLTSRITIILLWDMLLFRDIRIDSIKISLRCLLIIKNESMFVDYKKRDMTKENLRLPLSFSL